MKSKGHLINEKGKPVKASWLIKGMLKGVYFVTAHDPKNAKSNTPFRVRVGKGEGKEGIYGRITAHQSSNFDKLGINVEVGDYIFPYESDVFHHEDSKEEIQSYLQQLKPNTGFRSTWIDFVENQFYAFKSTLKPFLKEEWVDQGRS